MKKFTNNEMKRNLLKGFTGILFAVSTVVLPLTGYAEEAAVKPQEQVFLDPDQAEAAKRQLEADAYYNAKPQNPAPVVKEEPVKETVVGTKPVTSKEHAAKEAAGGTKSAEQTAAEVKIPAQAEAETKPAAADEKKAAQPAYVMPKEQVYLDPVQAEAAKRQLEADAYYNAKPQNPAPVVKVEPVKKEPAKESVTGAKPVMSEEKPAKETVAGTKPVTSEEKPAKESVTGAKPVAQTVTEVKVPAQAETEAKPAAADEKKAARPVYVMPQEQVYLDPSQAEAAKQQLKADAYYNAKPQTPAPVVKEEPVKKEPAKESASEVKAGAQTKTEAKPLAAGDRPAAAPEAKKEEMQAAVPVKPAEEGKPSAVAGTKTGENTSAAPLKQGTGTVAEGSAGPAKKPVQLRRMGIAKDFLTHHATVADVLKDMNVNMEGRSSYPPPEAKVEGGMVIHVLGRKSFVSHEEVEIPFRTRIVNDPSLAFGTKKVETAGVKGKDIVTYENITRIGYEQKIELDRRHVVAPVDEVIRQGVAQSVLTPNGYMRYKKKIYGEATAYTWGGGATGTTSLGLWPKRGIVAVDPRVIPYYTKMYIPGYGMAMAGDTGGAIVGTRIDLFMDSLRECFQWGRRGVEIYILE